MRYSALLLIVALTSSASAAYTQGGIKLPDVAGTWVVQAMVGPKDSVVVREQIRATAHGKGWTMTFPGRPAIPVRVVASGGDSVVTEAGPYPSALRPGQTVTLLRNVSHYKGDTMTGTFEAHYSSGEVFRGRTMGTRKK